MTVLRFRTGVNVVFINDAKRSLAAVVDLVNTLPAAAPDGTDTLTSLDDLNAFLLAHPYTGLILRDAGELAAIRAIRPRLHALWGVDRLGAVPLINAMLRDGHALPQLAIHDGYDWHIHATSSTAPLATRILVEAAMAFVDVVRGDQYDRVRLCDADDCAAVYIDYSRNGSKRYCDTGNCGNRMNVNAYRQRKARESV